MDFCQHRKHVQWPSQSPDPDSPEQSWNKVLCVPILKLVNDTKWNVMNIGDASSLALSKLLTSIVFRPKAYNSLNRVMWGLVVSSPGWSSEATVDPFTPESYSDPLCSTTGPASLKRPSVFPFSHTVLCRPTNVHSLSVNCAALCCFRDGQVLIGLTQNMGDTRPAPSCVRVKTQLVKPPELSVNKRMNIEVDFCR